MCVTILRVVTELKSVCERDRQTERNVLLIPKIRGKRPPIKIIMVILIKASN